MRRDEKGEKSGREWVESKGEKKSVCKEEKGGERVKKSGEGGRKGKKGKKMKC
jgi:hypothetical protein